VIVSHRGDEAAAGSGAEGTVVWLRGDHDAATATAVWESFERAIAVDDADLVVDLSRVTFIDASTIGVLVHARRALAEQSRVLSLRGASPWTAGILHLCGLEASGPASSSPVDSALASWVAVPVAGRLDAGDEPTPSPEPIDDLGGRGTA
jgi:anti-anti-sigma factor